MTLSDVFPGKTALEKIFTGIGTGFGLGMIAPVAPGTVGTAPGILASYWITTFPIPLQILACIGLTLLAIPCCEVAERVLGKKDDGRICADEWMLFPICLIGLPIHAHSWLLPVCFLVARICDIIKPPPARGLQRIHGGFGIVIDDLFAQLYALAINHGIFYVVMRYLSA